MSPDSSFASFFEEISNGKSPHEWQVALAATHDFVNRTIRVPTGFGKTLGVLATWTWHRVRRNDDRWPRRLVWCLPMRVLVEQTEADTRTALDTIGALWDGRSDHTNKVGVHLLMGGADTGDWHIRPEQYAVLIGTQDMLLSRALNRGYSSPRARWPMEFGLLHHDCLWVMDEVQLMDVGLATSAQLQVFRDDTAWKGQAIRPCSTWWMSATLQRDWLARSPDTQEMAASLPVTAVPASARTGHLWDNVSKPVMLQAIRNLKELAGLITSRHIDAGRGAMGPTLVVVNTVERALQVFKALTNSRALAGSDIRLVHSRFRPHERARWRDAFLNREACAPNTDRIIVSTQVVEAGVDLSAGLLITELAPWPSLVQRFGRAARWGGTAQIVVVDFDATDDKKAAPYTKVQLDAAREALASLSDVAPLHLERFEEQHAELLPGLYPYEPNHILLRHEIDELFDTTPDLSGADIDVSRFIRSGDERDLNVFWAYVPQKAGPDSELKPSREAMCAVPFLKARDWLCGNESASAKAPRLKKGMRAWVWDWVDGQWRAAERRDLYPGQTVLVDANCGGYDAARGWAPDSTQPVSVVETQAAPTTTRMCWALEGGEWVEKHRTVSGVPADEEADAAQDSEDLSVSQWETIASHGRNTGIVARSIASELAPHLAELFDLAGRWHDVGKAHAAFQASIRLKDRRPERQDLAKAPDAAWPCNVRGMYWISPTERRGGFRHELASALALFGVLQRHAPDHRALLGPWRQLLEQAGMTPHEDQRSDVPPTLLEQEVLALDGERFDLLVYLVCTHHGKVRLAWHASAADQAAADNQPRLRGIRNGDVLPPLLLFSRNDTLHELPPTVLDLTPATAGLNARTGAGWTERALSLLGNYGPFALAWLEALLRAADQRASKRSNPPDVLLSRVSP